MPPVILLVGFFTFIIHYIDTLSYSVRIAGVRTGHIALATSLFNMLMLFSRSANVIQAPLLTNYVEKTILNNDTASLVLNFRFLILTATFAAAIGAVCVPTFHRLMALAIGRFRETGSIPRMIFSSLKDRINPGSAFKLPAADSVKSLAEVQGIPFWPVFLNMIVVAVHAIGVLSAIYAGTLISSYRATAITLSAVVNSIATILYFVVVDPTIAFMTDQTLSGKISQGRLRRLIVFMVAGKIAGTILAQVLFIPAAKVISSATGFISTRTL